MSAPPGRNFAPSQLQLVLDDLDDTDVYKVEEIVAHDIPETGEEVEHFVKWKGFPSSAPQSLLQGLDRSLVLFRRVSRRSSNSSSSWRQTLQMNALSSVNADDLQSKSPTIATTVTTDTRGMLVHRNR
ncbi:hypothetical protein EDD21DRAFT_357876 [Dissophora ornata]|nr:hypothetical protein EDD21DRAFT_357876 [Dissophora ornata]